jgi:predicted nucleic acid-binding protein
MKIAITDANVFIDLIKIDMLEYLFKIKLEIHTCHAIANELNSSQFAILYPYVERDVLKLHELNENDLINISKLNGSKKLSPQDISVLYLAAKIEASVLTGDKLIKKLCVSRNIDAKGILWIIDMFIRHELISITVAFHKLDLLTAINDRLPRKECDEFKLKWLPT